MDEEDKQQLNEDEESGGGKILMPVIIILAMINFFADILDIVAVISIGVPLVGWVVYAFDVIVAAFAFVTTEGYLIMKGGIGFKKQATYLIGAGADFIPLLNILPMKTAVFLISVYLINHPNMAAIGKLNKPIKV